ncbi:endonuclease/exonuclease/phosphatase family protein [Pseudorhodoferax sp. Leaf267]|uniref:endonuclease/exonuclease/phosphatase family protein n=1 Tax=Pseudorhodoferax sp. Leaf267 TaxID=1736316 RepID=UPI0006F3837E|nr:endonuclease/exonuclease/phosphatase family protein [Pseudorhodoferax sp. Leaf267]KQP17596.1 endonuclease [Pseudorhodoferax sp. Leaf267]
MKILTWNVQWFCGLDDVVDVDRVIRHAQAWCDADVLCLQEVAIDYAGLTGNAGFDQVARVRALLPGFAVFFGAAVDERGRDGQRQRFGNLVATRLQVEQVQHHALPWPADGGVRSMPRMCTSVTVSAPFGPVRIMTTHLEFYSKRQRMAQAHALVDLHRQACGHAAQPPLDDESGGPFQNKRHTASAVLCGDFNFETVDEEYRVLQAAGPHDTTRLVDAWTVAHAGDAHAPTFRVFDRRYGPEPISCDFFYLSEDLAPRVRQLMVDEKTQLSDHQPVVLELG